MSDQIQQQLQQANNDINVLKVRVFDFQEALAAKDNELKQYQAVVNDIIKLTGLQDGGQGITAESVVAAVAALVPSLDEPEGEQLLTEAK